MKKRIPAMVRLFLFPLMGKIILASLVLTLLMEILILLDQAEDILHLHLGIAGLARFACLHLPTLLVQTLPVAVLLGSILALMQMATSSEIAVLRASGLTSWKLYLFLTPAPIFLGLIGACLQLTLVPVAEQNLNRWWNEALTVNDKTSSLPGVWIRQGEDLTHAEKVKNGGSDLEKVTFYSRDSTGKILKIISLPEIRYVSKSWNSTTPGTTAHLLDPEPPVTVRGWTGKIPFSLSPAHVMQLAAPVVLLSFSQLWAILWDGAANAHPQTLYMMNLLGAGAFPLQLAVLLLMALPVTYIPPRSGIRNPLPIYVLAMGMTLIVGNGLIAALGNAGTLPPWVAILIQPVVGCMLAITWIIRMEEK